MLIEAYLRSVPLWSRNQLQTTHLAGLIVLLLIFILGLFAGNNQPKEGGVLLFVFQKRKKRKDLSGS